MTVQRLARRERLLRALLWTTCLSLGTLVALEVVVFTGVVARLAGTNAELYSLTLGNSVLGLLVVVSGAWTLVALHRPGGPPKRDLWPSVVGVVSVASGSVVLGGCAMLLLASLAIDRWM